MADINVVVVLGAIVIAAALFFFPSAMALRSRHEDAFLVCIVNCAAVFAWPAWFVALAWAAVMQYAAQRTSRVLP